MKSFKVLHLNGNLSEGGVEQYLSQLFPALHAHNIENVLIYGEAPEETPHVEAVKPYYIEGITRVFIKNQNKKLLQVKEIIYHERPDIIYLHQVANASLVKLVTSLLPTVKFVHDCKLICPDGQKTLKTKTTLCPFPLGYLCQIRAYAYRCMPRNPFIGMSLIHHSRQITSLYKDRSQMVVASGFMRSVLINNGFDDARISVIPIFTDIPLPAPQPVSSKEPMILAVGRIVPAKGMDYLLRAFSLIKEDIRLTIAGDGPQLPDLKSMADELGISSRVTFTGWLNHDGLDDLYRSCTLVIVPSVWHEPFGMVGIEAMAYAKPVVAFDVGGISEWLIDGGTGFLVKPRDVVGLADKIKTILNDPDLAEKMGAKALDIVKKRFLAESHISQLLTIFEKTIDSFLKSNRLND